jgi:serine/threonine protein kinase
LGEDTFNSENVAVKVFRQNHNGRLLFENEARILGYLPTHPNLLRYVGQSDLEKQRCIALELFEHPSLASFLAKKGALSEDLALHIISQLIEVVHYLHQHLVAHRDIKPENILIDKATAKIKLIDFGLSSFITNAGAEDDFYVGTPVYMSPQLLQKGSVYKIIASDAWAIGITLYELLTGANPLRKAKSDAEVLRLIPSVLKFEKLPACGRRIVEGLLSHDEDDRMTLMEAAVVIADREREPRDLLKSRKHRRSTEAQRRSAHIRPGSRS